MEVLPNAHPFVEDLGGNVSYLRLHSELLVEICSNL